MPTTELVTFRLSGADRDAFIAANAQVNHWVRQQTGFVSRTLSEGADGEWTDIVIWSSAEDAEAAAAQMNQDMDRFEAMAMIEPSSIVMRHAAVVLSA
ncbi:hypothetical protein NIM87_04170 [Devosia sp. XJ19-1]|uniref:ABM domain-containing protein n=1 Tax=Devosia ureilytica TaxID=2952754 RepID=A0A9Q4AMM6_9HYPH|nr:hypothetical protein [Devosia ureilytica]MCP8882684.1 hypothetical protein [Devosia ureilytica]MCP8886948.1 hypothetical protein [Devosia ureilytica]